MIIGTPVSQSVSVVCERERERKLEHVWVGSYKSVLPEVQYFVRKHNFVIQCSAVWVRVTMWSPDIKCKMS